MAINTHAPFQLSGARPYQDAAESVEVLDPLIVDEWPDDKGAYLVRLASTGEPVGVISANKPVAIALSEGQVVLEATVNCANAKESRGPSVRITTGDVGDELPPPIAARSYTVNIVGEQFYQDAIAHCAAGERVKLLHEYDNPYDNRAILVEDCRGMPIGHIAKDTWLQRALLDERQGFHASISDVSIGIRGFSEIQLSVTLEGDGIESRSYLQRSSL